MKKVFTLPSILFFFCATLTINSCSNRQDEQDEPNEPNQLPTVTVILLPIQHSSYFMGEIMDIEILANDSDGDIAQVEIMLNGTSIALLYSKPYKLRYEIKNIQPGDYNLKLVVTDDQGEQRSLERAIKILPDLEEFIDTRDGNVYHYITIGKQTWLVENLAFLPDVSPSIKGSESIPYYYVFNYEGNDVSTAMQAEEYSKYGVLYNFEAAKQAPPEGWHLPTVSEWQELRDYMIDELGKSNSVFLLHRKEGGTNYFGFSAVSAGMRLSTSFWNYHRREPDTYFLSGNSWWSSSYNKEFHPMCFSRDIIGLEEPDAGLSIRCIKD